MLEKNSIIKDVTLVNVKSRVYNDKTYYNAIIVLNNYPVSVNCDSKFFEKFNSIMEHQKVGHIKECDCCISNYKGEWRVTLLG